MDSGPWTLARTHSIAMPDAAPEFKQLLREAFEAVQVGQTFTFRRTFTDGDVSLFIGVTKRSIALHCR